MTHDKKLNRQAFFAQTAIRFSQKIEVLFSGNPANIEQANFAVRCAEFFKECGISSVWMEQFGVQAARQNFQFCRIESAFNPALLVLFGINEDSVELPVKPMHVTPRHALEKTVLGEDPNILREIGMIDAAGLQVEHFGRKQRS